MDQPKWITSRLTKSLNPPPGAGLARVPSTERNPPRDWTAEFICGELPAATPMLQAAQRIASVPKTRDQRNGVYFNRETRGWDRLNMRSVPVWSSHTYLSSASVRPGSTGFTDGVRTRQHLTFGGRPASSRGIRYDSNFGFQSGILSIQSP